MCQRSDIPLSVKIKKINKETPFVMSFVFDYPHRALPGQFVNVWIPGIDEKPISVAFDDGKSYTIAVAAVGEMTKELAKKKVGDFIGIRGPYGTNYGSKSSQFIAMVAGGYGVAPLYFAAVQAIKAGCRVDFHHGARTKNYLLFADRVKKLKNTRYLPATDDGSLGHEGNCVNLMIETMNAGAKYDLIMTCGPEPMMKAVSDVAWKKKIDAQVSVERYMKCGLGICGNCCVDDLGIRTCQEGPIMPLSQIRKIKEFGLYHRNSVGKKHSF
ncbi:dihydroorotate dehydrogenase electron transfer subunit [Candidatus Peregrinibacteria bacterium]|nr:dihydroorotate dehydrogenase electron transfer subunit [Candidatus Peregrinibacteria bacterium]